MIGRTSRIVIEVIAASLIGLALIVTAAAWRLTQGPVSLAFLTREVEDALNSRGAPVRIRVENTVLTWAGWDRPLDVRVVGVRALAADGQTVANVPEMSVRFSGRALLTGVIAPTSLELVGADVRLVRSAEGRIELAMGEAERGSGDFLGALIHAVASPPAPDSPAGYLNRVSILGGRLVIDDRMSGTLWGAPRADLVLMRRGGDVRAEFGLDLDLGGRNARIDGTAGWRPESRQVDIEANISDLRPDRIAAKLPSLGMAESLQLPVGGKVALSLRADGRIESATFALSGRDGRIERPELWPRGLEVAALELRGRYEAEPGRLAVDALTLDLGGPTIAFRGSAVRLDERFAVDGAVVLRQLPVSDLARYWPAGLGPKPRQWVTTNLSAGMLGEATVDLSLRSEGGSADMAVEALSGTLKLSGVTVTFLDGMPPVRRINATGTFARDRMLFNVQRGELDGLSIDAGTVRLTGLGGENERAEVETVIRGPVPRVLAVVDRPRLGYATAVGIEPAKAKGEAAVRLAVSLPLIENLTFQKVEIAAAANMRDVAVPGIAYGRDLTDGTLVLRVDKRAMSVEGSATLGPTPVSLKWYERFGPGAGYKRRYEVRGTVDEAGRAAFGLAFPAYLRGPVAVELKYGERPDGAGEGALELGLAQAELAVPPLGRTTQPAAGDNATLTVSLANGRLVAIPHFDIRTRDLKASGAARFTGERQLASLDLARFSLGATDISGRLAARPDGGYDIVVRGSGLDAAPLLRRSDDESESDLPPLAIDAQLESLWCSTGQPIRKASGRLLYDGKLWREIDVAGLLDEKQTVSLKVATAGTTRTMTFEASDAGAALRALDVLDTVAGGRLLLAMTRDASRDQNAWRGNLAMRDISVVKAPILARLLSLASLTGIVNALSGKGIAFARVDVPLVLKDGVAHAENARAVGSELGLTANGDVDMRNDRLNLEGTIVPAYTINSVLGNIPLLGQIFTGDKGSGVFAATYRIQGPLGDPQVSVNPLAALAPGFLRNLLGIFDRGDEPNKGAGDSTPEGQEPNSP